MTLIKQTTNGQGGVQTNPAAVQHQHPANVTISRVGEGEDAESREPTTSQASSASPS